MADNIAVLDGAGASKTMRTTDTAGVHSPHHIVDSSALPTGASTEATLAAVQAAVEAIQTAVEILDNIVSGNEAQVDVLTLPALPAGTNNIGDVDVLSLPAAQITTAEDTDGTETEPWGRGAVGKPGPVELADSTGEPIGVSGAELRTLDARAHTAQVDAHAIGARSPSADALALQTFTLFRDQAVSSTPVLVQTGATFVYREGHHNPHASDMAYLHYYDAADDGDVTVGTTVPVWTVPLFPKGGNDTPETCPIPFTLGLVVAATTSQLHTGTTAPTTAVVAQFGVR